ncbi:MAG: DegQ family serine endoprotease [Burkholderiales bacterium]|nr:DegQ family serine endoprotease [Burkholderiales bacterium]
MSANKTLVPVLLSLALIGCMPGKQPTVVSASPQPSVQQTAPVPGVMLPDFSSLVAKEGSAVVNISSTRIVRDSDQSPQDGQDNNDPFFDFFHRFMPNPPQPPREYQSKSLGSGFIISHDGYILTNAHVIDDSDEVTVKLTDKREFRAKVVGSDKNADIAVLKIKAKDLPIVPIGDPSRLKVGEWVLAIGSPFGFDNSVTAGIVSAKGRNLPDENYVPFIQTDVPINPGNSGGPLFNMKGEVVGINSQIYSRTGGYMGLSFAIPIDVAMNIGNQLRENGKVSRGRLGVEIQELNQDLAKSFGMPDANGALVATVEKGSPAEKAGIRPGDVIIQFNGKPVNSSTELPALVGATKPGSHVKVKIWRNGSAQEVEVLIGELQSATPPQEKPHKRMHINRIGLATRDLTTDEKKAAGTDHGIVVVKVQGALLETQLAEGDIILALNHTEVDSTEQFNDLLSQIPRGRTVALLVKRGGNSVYIPIRVN